MATKRAAALVLERKRLATSLSNIGVDKRGPIWLDVLALERAAIAVGKERERGRQAKRKGPRR